MSLQKNSLQEEVKKKYSADEVLQIQRGLYNLALSKNLPAFSNDAIKEFINEFENLQWTVNNVLTAIENVKYNNTFGAVKFSDFINQEWTDDLIPQTQVYRKAMDTIKIHQDKFRLFCQEYYGTTLISREQVTKILDLLNKNEISQYDLQNTKKHVEWLKNENEKIENMKNSLSEKKDELRDALAKIIEDAYNNSNIPDVDKKASSESVVYLAIKDLNKSL